MAGRKSVHKIKKMDRDGLIRDLRVLTELVASLPQGVDEQRSFASGLICLAEVSECLKTFENEYSRHLPKTYRLTHFSFVDLYDQLKERFKGARKNQFNSKKKLNDAEKELAANAIILILRDSLPVSAFDEKCISDLRRSIVKHYPDSRRMKGSDSASQSASRAAAHFLKIHVDQFNKLRANFLANRLHDKSENYMWSSSLITRKSRMGKVLREIELF